MNPTSKKLLSLFLIFSLMMLSVNLYAKERRGAKLIVTKKNGYETEGELITVKKDSLLILTKWTGRDESIDIADIRIITIVKKSTVKAFRGAVLGAAICIGGCVLIGAVGGEPPVGSSGLVFGLMNGIRFSPIAILLGGFIGGTAVPDKTIHFKGMSDSEIRAALDKLRKKARIRDYK